MEFNPLKDWFGKKLIEHFAPGLLSPKHRRLYNFIHAISAFYVKEREWWRTQRVLKPDKFSRNFLI